MARTKVLGVFNPRGTRDSGARGLEEVRIIEMGEKGVGKSTIVKTFLSKAKQKFRNLFWKSVTNVFIIFLNFKIMQTFGTNREK